MMECHDVRLLLAFTQRPCEAVDDAEREAVVQHLHGCPECAALAQGERALDNALGRVMREVAAPADLKPKVMKRLAESRGRRRWKWPATVAAAASLLLAVGLSWHHWSRPVVTSEDLAAIVVQDRWDAERASHYLAEHGLSVNLPHGFDFDRCLQTVEIVEFKGRRVAKLGLFVSENNATASAIVLILPHNQFRTESIADTNLSGWDVQILHQDDCSYVIFSRGQLNWLRPIGA